MKEKYHLAFLDMAERFGQTSTATRLKVGTLIVKNGSVIALGVNGMPPKWPSEVCEDETNTTLPECRHSEIAALEKLWNSSETALGATIYVSHAPCKNCSIKIATAGISGVYFRHGYRCNNGVNYLIARGVVVKQQVGDKFEVLQIKPEIQSDDTASDTAGSQFLWNPKPRPPNKTYGSTRYKYKAQRDKGTS